ncbi:MAG: DNA polymerase III subunit gamma/tau [Nitrospirae bacterium]|nr:DNA polymerase III subunit gamma/tau [Nitrospirota bacterium]
MSYLVLARKWRPLFFEELVGQEAVIRTLQNALRQGRVAHAYVFSGPRGVGKTTTARILSRALNCQKGPTPQPCGKCPNCIAITEGSAVDVIEIDGASNRGINEIRELREGVRYAPSSGRYKVYIIDEVHMLTKEAFNALLKTLEEPPPHVVFVFATTSPKNIPITVLSRCQHLNFRRVPKARIMEHLSYICGQEKATITPGALEMIARVAEGSVRDSLTVLDQAMAFSTDIRDDVLQTMLGLPERSVLFGIAGMLLGGNRAGLLDYVNTLADEGGDLRTFPRELVTMFRNLLIVRVAERPASLLELPDDEIEELKALADRSSSEELMLMLNEFLKLEGDIRAVTNPRYLLELSFIRATFFKGAASIDTIIERLEAGLPEASQLPISLPPSLPHPLPARPVAAPPSKPVAQPSAAKPEPPAPEPPAPPPAVSENIAAYTAAGGGDLWQKIIDAIDAKNHRLASMLGHGRLAGMNEIALTIAFDTASDFYLKSARRSIDDIEALIAAIIGRRLRVELVAGEGIAEDARPKPAEVKGEILKEPVVQKVIDLFDARVVDVRPLGGYFEKNGGDDV